jgi:hypothetical protein
LLWLLNGNFNSLSLVFSDKEGDLVLGAHGRGESYRKIRVVHDLNVIVVAVFVRNCNVGCLMKRLGLGEEFSIGGHSWHTFALATVFLQLDLDCGGNLFNS